MAKEFSKEIKAAERVIAVQKRPKDRDMFNKKDRKKLLSDIKPSEQKLDFIKDLKTQLSYGDTGHGILLDKKV
jgi:hypothetical protein